MEYMTSESSSGKGILAGLRRTLFIERVPTYGNSIFYSLGFLALTSLTILIASGVVMVFFGPSWWLANPWGIFFRSIHLWAAQAFILIILLHVLVILATSGFKKPRRLTWVLGAAVLLLVLAEAEFGYELRGDFSSQYRSLQAADFFNGAYLGRFINTLNFAQVYGIHIIDIPLAIIALVGLHYLFVKLRGIATPYRKDVPVRTVPADHRKLFLRGGILAIVILALARIFPSPLIAPTTIKDVASQNPPLMAGTLLEEWSRTSGTATYFDSIDPYTFDTRKVYVEIPYREYLAGQNGPGLLGVLASSSPDAVQTSLTAATAYFSSGGALAPTSSNPLIAIPSVLTKMAQRGLYGSVIDGENRNIAPTYSLRFLADTGVMDAEASDLRITTDQWGMMREESGAVPPGAWWLAPLGILNHTILANDANGDRDAAEILGMLALLLVLFPYIPFVNRIPEKLPFARWIWRSGK